MLQYHNRYFHSCPLPIYFEIPQYIQPEIYKLHEIYIYKKFGLIDVDHQLLPCFLIQCILLCAEFKIFHPKEDIFVSIYPIKQCLVCN